ncbi:host attachment protein [Salinarimonas sp. NSM]|uniref:host attachment protein n=1 Tax=Salinarimonas sp. NSM TaxID=3458003 RepID=UPI004035D7EC
MSDIALPAGALVLVADASKGLILRNDGVHLAPRLSILRAIEAPANPPARALGTDAPGRTRFGTRRAAMQEVDRHDRAENAFARALALAIDEARRDLGAKAVVVVAPPRFLAALRDRLPEETRRCLVGEDDRDLVGHPIAAIERIFAPSS